MCYVLDSECMTRRFLLCRSRVISLPVPVNSIGGTIMSYVLVLTTKGDGFQPITITQNSSFKRVKACTMDYLQHKEKLKQLILGTNLDGFVPELVEYAVIVKQTGNSIGKTRDVYQLH